ncbi:MAG: alanine racemase [Parvularcula sp.]
MSLPANRPILTINRAALVENARALQKQAGHPIAACVKANAYGIGASETVRTLCSAVGIKTFFVAYAAEAAAIVREIDRADDLTFFVLNGPAREDAQLFALPGIIPVMNSLSQADLWQQMGGGPFALGIDIGMNRLGMTEEDALKSLEILGTANARHVLMHLSHSGRAEAPQNRVQQETYQRIVSGLKTHAPHLGYSLSASGGILLPRSFEETFSRVGASLYGLSPTGQATDALAPVATLSAPVLQLRSVEAGTTLGYNGIWTAKRPSHIATLAIGYADGLQRALGNRGQAVVNGQQCPIVGAVSMDLTAIDVTDCDQPPSIGQHAEVYGETILIDDQAAAAGTIGYELLSTIGPRVERRYCD